MRALVDMIALAWNGQGVQSERAACGAAIHSSSELSVEAWRAVGPAVLAFSSAAPARTSTCSPGSSPSLVQGRGMHMGMQCRRPASRRHPITSPGLTSHHVSTTDQHPWTPRSLAGRAAPLAESFPARCLRACDRLEICRQYSATRPLCGACVQRAEVSGPLLSTGARRPHRMTMLYTSWYA